MLLEGFSLPVSVSRQEAIRLMEEMLSESGWRDIKLSPKLVFEPHYFIEFDCFSEQEQKVSETQTGVIAMNAISRELSEETVELAEGFEPVANQEIEEDFEFKKPSLKEDAAKKVALAQLSKQLKFPMQNIQLSSFTLVFFPFWVSPADFEGQKTEIRMSALDGEIVSAPEEIAERGQTLGELGAETISDLKKPSAWVKYPAGIAKGIGSNTVLAPIGRTILSSTRIQIAILIIIIALLLLSHFRII